MQKKHLLIGYVQSRALPDVTPEDARKMTHINIAFSPCERRPGDCGKHPQSGLPPKAQGVQPQIGILLSVGGWGVYGFSEAAATAAGRQRFAQTSVEILRTYKLDGIDIDWEYPTYGWAGIDASPEDRYTFTLLLE